jgi:putative intracellular protease/amidase
MKDWNRVFPGVAMTHPAPTSTHRIGILLFEDFEPLDVWGFAEAFTIARFPGKSHSEKGPHPFEVRFIAKKVSAVRSSNGPQALPDYSIAQAMQEKFDVLMVPGGMGTRSLIDDQETLDFLKFMDTQVSIMASVCTGAVMLAKLGLLDGLPATTNRAAFDWVAKQGPRVLWDNVSRWVDAGRYVTSAGVSAGIDMAFYLVSRLAGVAVADMAAQAAEYDWHRDPKHPVHS